MKKLITLTLSFIFPILFSGTSTAGLFSPNDFNECIFQNMKDAKNNLSVVSTYQACKSKFPEKPPKGPSGLFGPKSYNDCIIKYNKGVTHEIASTFIMSACSDKFEKTKK